MLSLKLSRYRLIALILIFEIAFNIFIRYMWAAYGWYDLYTYGNDLCLILLSIIPLLLVRGIDFILAVGTFILFTGNIIDDKFFGYDSLGINEIVYLIIYMILVIVWFIYSKYRNTNYINLALLPIIALFSLVTRNPGDFPALLQSFGIGAGPDEIYYTGDAIIHALWGAFMVVNFRKGYYSILSNLFAGLTVYNLLDERYKPNQVHISDIAIPAYFILRAIWLFAWEYYRENAKVRTMLVRIAIVFHTALFGLVVIWMGKLYELTAMQISVIILLGVMASIVVLKRNVTKA